jgi:hypothetical protein
MTIAGALSDVLLLDVLQVLSVTARTGKLVVEQPDQRVELTFATGRLVTARLEPPRYHLASYFLEQGWIDFEALHEALKRQAREEYRRLTGQILIEMGVLTHEQLVTGLQHHVHEVLCELLSWTRGSFRFEPLGANLVNDLEGLGVGLGGDDLRQLATETREQGDSPRDPSTGFGRSLDDASWLAKPRLSLIVTDDLLVRHGLELRLRSHAFALVATPGVQQVDDLLLATGDPEPVLVVDLDLVGRERTEALQAFHALRKIRDHWPNLRLLTFGRQVPEAFYRFVLRGNVAFHLPRASASAEGDIRVVRDFIEVLGRLVMQDGFRPSDAPAASVPE